jgi:hypothetical protein
MKESLNALLLAEELHSLREVHNSPRPGEIPREHKSRLIELGFVTERMGALEITLVGEIRLSIGL